MKLNKKRVAVIVVVAVLGFIFINSMLNSALSIHISSLPQRFIHIFLPYSKYPTIDYILSVEIRKIAHFLEYAILSVVITKMYYMKKREVQRIINSLAIVFFVALIDETIQIFSGRGSRISDIWIDLLGAIFGFFALYLWDAFRKSKNK